MTMRMLILVTTTTIMVILMTAMTKVVMVVVAMVAPVCLLEATPPQQDRLSVAQYGQRVALWFDTVWHSGAQWGSANANGTVCGTPVAPFLIESQCSALVWQGGRFQLRTGGAGGG